ncbi:MAG: DUF192 domain-containing protein [Granulosicoccus sp.]
MTGNKPMPTAVLALCDAALHRQIAWVLLLLSCLCGVHSTQAKENHPGAQPQLPTIKLLVGGQPMVVEIASSANQRFMGLSFRRSMAEDAGMLFVYPQEQALTFTMRNTLIPLSIAFISKDLVVNEIHEMNVGPGQLFPARQKAQYALEVNQGWFAKNGVKPGAQLVMP